MLNDKKGEIFNSDNKKHAKTTRSQVFYLAAA